MTENEIVMINMIQEAQAKNMAMRLVLNSFLISFLPLEAVTKFKEHIEIVAKHVLEESESLMLLGDSAEEVALIIAQKQRTYNELMTLANDLKPRT